MPKRTGVKPKRLGDVSQWAHQLVQESTQEKLAAAQEPAKLTKDEIYASCTHPDGLQRNLLYITAMYGALPRFLAVTLLAGALHAAPTPPMSLRWNDLSGAILNKNVIVDLTDGSRVKAVAVFVQPTGLAVNVSSNSNPTYKKGQVAIPREQIMSLRLIKMRTRGRIIGTSLGAVLGMTVGLGLGVALDCSCGARNEAAIFTAIIGVPVGLAVAGYFIGRSADRQEILINILPE